MASMAPTIENIRGEYSGSAANVGIHRPTSWSAPD